MLREPKTPRTPFSSLVMRCRESVKYWTLSRWGAGCKSVLKSTGRREGGKRGHWEGKGDTASPAGDSLPAACCAPSRVRSVRAKWDTEAKTWLCSQQRRYRLTTTICALEAAWAQSGGETRWQGQDPPMLQERGLQDKPGYASAPLFHLPAPALCVLLYPVPCGH